MTDRKKIGILLILIGFLIPLLTLPFLSGYAKDKGIIENLYGVGIELRKAENNGTEGQTVGRVEKTPHKTPDFAKLIPKRIPLRLFLVITLILLYMGIVKVVSPGRQDDSIEDKE